MRSITDCIRADREFSAMLACLTGEAAATKPLPLLINGLSGGAVYAFAAAAARECRAAMGAPVLFLLPDDAGCEKLAALLAADGSRACVYPARDAVFYPVTVSHDIDRARLSVLHALLGGECDAVVTTPAAALQYTIPRARLTALVRDIRVGSRCTPEEICALLEAMGYARMDAVDGAGQYARRGGIIDIFHTHEERPVRMEFFGDEIDRMRRFDPLSQRSLEDCPAFSLLPACEVLPDGDARARIRAVVEKLKKKAPQEAQAALSAELAALDGGTAVLAADKYLPLIYPEEENLLSYLTDSGKVPVFLHGTRAVEERLTAALSLWRESVIPLSESGAADGSLLRTTADRAAFDRFLSENPTVHLNTFSGGMGMMRTAGMFGFRCRAGVSYAGKSDLLREDLRNLTESGYRVLLLTETEGEEGALCDALRADGFPVSPLPPDEPFPRPEHPAGCIFATHGSFPGGFELLTPRVAVLSLLPDADTVRRARRPRKHAPKAGERLLSYAELREGDPVVHAVHGIGIFTGMTTMTVDGVTRDYITIQYAGKDKLFLPADRLEMISRYIGTAGEDGKVKLSRLGGTEWQRATGRAKAAAREMAHELIRLYAARMRRPGFAFPKDDAMQEDFEAAFPFDETDSQIAAAEEIRQDMQKPVPMERLLCGDVGYGKTEVAFRAAFRAVCAGKQVAILVPTTILALQHYETALSRMRGFPVTVEMLSRFRTPKQQAQILRRLSRGEIDILVGTHKLLGKQVVFHDLGLLIVDEEQRFGVAQKEKLRTMAENIDTLTLTATPIPRTLNMAMSGIRDMSLLDEAPGDRHPVQTYVMEHDDGMIDEAIRRELRRGGQVIYLYNRVETIDSVAARLGRSLPDARIVTAHGKMDKDTLEDIWQALCRGEIDVIVCTTIVETGVDLPNANTLIIEDADRLGLSQLHQLRGRVGRSNRQAYAYFTYRAGKALSDVATKRLSAIREYAAFGAGFRIALRDLEIRGAGNLLGAEQHGHIESVGYDMYIRLLNEAVLEEKGELPAPRTEAVVDLRVDAHIPENYIPTAAGRMELYKKISLIREDEDRQDIFRECADRYGPPPPQISHLLAVALTRALASRMHFPRVEQNGAELRILLGKPDLAVWSVLFSERSDLRFRKEAPPCVSCRLPAGAPPAETAAELLVRYAAVADGIAAEAGQTNKEVPAP